MKRHIALLLAATCAINIPIATPFITTQVIAADEYTTVLKDAMMVLTDGTAFQKYKFLNNENNINDYLINIARTEILSALPANSRFLAENITITANTKNYIAPTPEMDGKVEFSIILAVPARTVSSVEIDRLSIPIHYRDTIADELEFNNAIDQLNSADWELDIEEAMEWNTDKETIEAFYTETTAFATNKLSELLGTSDNVISKIYPMANEYKPVTNSEDGSIKFVVVSEKLGLTRVITVPITKPALPDDYDMLFKDVISLCVNNVFQDTTFPDDATLETSLEQMAYVRVLENMTSDQRVMAEYLEFNADNIDVLQSKFDLTITLKTPDGKINSETVTILNVLIGTPYSSDDFDDIIEEFQNKDWYLSKLVVDAWLESNTSFYEQGSLFGHEMLDEVIQELQITNSNDFDIFPLKRTLEQSTGDLDGKIDFIIVSSKLNKFEVITIPIIKPEPVGDYREVFDAAIKQIIDGNMFKNYKFEDTRNKDEIAEALETIAKFESVKLQTESQKRALAEYINFEITAITDNDSQTVKMSRAIDAPSDEMAVNVKITLKEPSINGAEQIIHSINISELVIPLYEREDLSEDGLVAFNDTVDIVDPNATSLDANNDWGLNIGNTADWKPASNIESFYTDATDYLKNKLKRLLRDNYEYGDDDDTKIEIIEELYPIANTYIPATDKKDGQMQFIVVSSHFANARILTVPIKLAPEYQVIFDTIIDLLKPEPQEDGETDYYKFFTDNNYQVRAPENEDDLAIAVENLIRLGVFTSDKITGDRKVLAEDVEFEIDLIDYDNPTNTSESGNGKLEFSLKIIFTEPVTRITHQHEFENLVVPVYLKVEEVALFDNLIDVLENAKWGLNISNTEQWDVENDSTTFYEETTEFGQSLVDNVLELDNQFEETGQEIIDAIYPLGSTYERVTEDTDGKIEYIAVSTYFNTAQKITVTIVKPDVDDDDEDEDDDDDDLIYDTSTKGGNTVLEISTFEDEHLLAGINLLIKEAIKRNTNPVLQLNVKSSRDEANVEINGGVLNTLLLSDKSTLIFDSKEGIIEFSNNAIKSIISQALEDTNKDETDEEVLKRKNIEFIIDADPKLTSKQEDTIEDYPAWNFSIEINGDIIENITGHMEVILPYRLEGDEPNDVYIYEVNERGKYEEIGIDYNEDEREATFDAQNLGTFIITENNLRLSDLLILREEELDKREKEAREREKEGQYVQDIPKEEIIQNPFIDISSNDWYYNDILAMYSKGLMSGMTGNTFKPDEIVTRATIIDILYKLDGSSPRFNSSLFNFYTDVEDDEWFVASSNWANNTRIFTGFEDVTYRPYYSITREQLAVIIYNYMQYKGIYSNNLASIYLFNDGISVTPSAYTAMSVVVGNYMLTSTQDGYILPHDNVTRGELAAAMNRLLYFIN